MIEEPILPPLPDFEEYIQQGEPDQRQRAENWQIAIGLQAVDGLHTSAYLKQTAQKHIEGEITAVEAKSLVDSYYKSLSGRKSLESDRTEEADRVSSRISELLAEKTFNFSPTQLYSIHRRLFTGLNKYAGVVRDYNIIKNELVLKGDTVLYASADMIHDSLEYDFSQEREYHYNDISVLDSVKHLTRFCADIWQIHPFCEGNTRTTAVFMIKYLHSLGFKYVTNEPFALHSWYFRNALVRANYNNLQKGIRATTEFLERFFRNLLLGDNNQLLNREMHLDWQNVQSANPESKSAKQTFQSANNDLVLPPKCKNCTLEEIAVLQCILKQPNITQKEMAAIIGKSERTIKSITIRLTEQGIISRKNGKRNGYWEIIND